LKSTWLLPFWRGEKLAKVGLEARSAGIQKTTRALDWAAIVVPSDTSIRVFLGTMPRQAA
jgi:hypothetical protein